MLFPKFFLSNVKCVRSHFPKLICTSSKLGKGAYDAEGKTYVDILDPQRHPELGLTIASFSQIGFRLGNGILCVGPIVLFSRSVLSWNVGGPYDITPESLSLFSRLEPKLDILVLGIGDDLEWRKMIIKNIYTDIIKKSGINVEILTTEHACSTYNFLCSEHRLVAGAFIPPLSINVTDQDVIDTKKRYDSLYELSHTDDPPEFYDIEETKKIVAERKQIAAKMNESFFGKKKSQKLSNLSEEGFNREYHEEYPTVESQYERIDREEKEMEAKRRKALKDGKEDDKKALTDGKEDGGKALNKGKKDGIRKTLDKGKDDKKDND